MIAFLRNGRSAWPESALCERQELLPRHRALREGEFGRGREDAADAVQAAGAIDPVFAERIVVITGGATCDADEQLLRASGVRVVY
ncbi:hypothetical protein [Anaeromyxobacter sp. Fw109-5]|uniref:hypothetical protein n=1 Tax=Anaeromyxobacter sp. (strain Fw109-5) TaxID=404589 RepID=UPI00031EC429|nr:hypothetical protein [Anaeromyxobacter sp. Fw109-5]